MIRILLFTLFFCILNNACDTSGSCSVYLASDKQQSCNIVVTDNINKSSRWVSASLKFKGIDLTTGKEVLYKSKTRDWSPLYIYINIGDTVVKNEGEAIMYVYKKDSIVIRNLSNMCNTDFDWKKDVYTFILRDSISE